MKLGVLKNYYYQFLFLLGVAITYLDHFELTIAVWSLVFLLTISNYYSVSLIKLLIPFFVILLTAFVVMLFYDYQSYFVIRDVTYLIKPIIGFLLGYQLYKKNSKKPFELILGTALFIASIHICVVVFAFLFQGATNLNLIREYGGYFSDYEVYALIILLFHEEFGLHFSPKKLKIYIAFIAISVLLYFARTNFIQLLILFLALKGYFKITQKSLTIFVSILTFCVVGYATIVVIDPKRNGKGVEAFLYKLKLVPIEPFKTKINREDYIDFNDNYRSWENIMTIRQVSRDSYWNVFFGKGLGSQIDLKQKVYLGDMELRFISILHNGFMIVFLKSGLFGILIYSYTIYFFFRKKDDEIPILKPLKLLFLGTGIFLVFSNWVFLGFYNLIDAKTILLGYLIAYSEHQKKII